LSIYYAATTDELVNDVGDELGHDAPNVKWVLLGLALAWVLSTLSMQLCCPLEYCPEGWHVPWWLMPWLPSAAIAMVVFR